VAHPISWLIDLLHRFHVGHIHKPGNYKTSINLLMRYRGASCYDWGIRLANGRSEASMTANVDAMVREAIRAYKAGQKAEAHALLLKATELDQMHEQAWMWLSAVVDTPEDQRICLENVIYINPDNENARRGLALLN